MRRRTGWWLAGGGVAIALVGALFAYPAVVRYEVIAQAHDMGVELEPTTIDVSLGSVTLTNASFSMLNGGLRGTIAKVTLETAFLSLRRIDAQGIDVQVMSSAAELLGEADDAHAANKPLPMVPLTARGVKLTWADLHLVVENANVDGLAGKVSVQAPSFSLGSRRIGSMQASLSTIEGKSVVAIGGDDPTEAPVRIDVDRTGKDLKISTVMKPIPIDATKRIVVEATTQGSLTKAGYVGTLDAKIRGVALPVPREVLSLVASPFVELKSDLTFTHGAALPAANHTDQVAMKNAVVTAGSVVLKGDLAGQLATGEHATAKGTLLGDIPCAAVAGSAAKAGLGDLLGGIAGAFAKTAVTGSVALSVSVDFDSTRADQLRVSPVIAPGCGVRFLEEAMGEGATMWSS